MAEFTKMLSQDFIYEAFRNPLQDEKCQQMHAGTCNMKSFSQFKEGCLGVYKMYLLVHLIPLLTLKRKRLIKDPVKEIRKVIVGFVKSLLFAGGYSMLVRRTICFLTNYYSYNYIVAYISGVVGGATLIFEPISRQSQIALYTLNKSMEVLYNMAVRRSYPVRIPYGECWLNAVALAVICFTYVNDPEIWRQSYRKVLGKLLQNI